MSPTSIWEDERKEEEEAEEALDQKTTQVFCYFVAASVVVAAAPSYFGAQASPPSPTPSFSPFCQPSLLFLSST